jgi:hypothetical protein
MRDPNRIDDVLREVRRVWKMYPDMRLGQLICNIADWAGQHVWDIEDDVLVEEANRIELKPELTVTADDS